VKKPTVRMRKPPTAPAADLEAFVAAIDKPAKGRGAKTSKMPGPSEVLRTKRGIMRRLTLYLPPHVARAFHARCIAEGTTMSAALEAWVADYIAKR
jgi:hypothetical protein